MCKKISGSPTNFLVMYVGDIQHIEKIVPILHLINDMLIIKVFMDKTWVKHPIFDIYRDKCKWMQGLSQSRYMKFILKGFQHEWVEKSLLTHIFNVPSLM